MTGCTLTFSDGSSVSVGALANDGSATLVTLPGTVVTQMIVLAVTSTSSATSNVGLAEFRAYGTICDGCALGNNFTNASATTTTSTGVVTGTGAYADLALLATASASSYGSSQPPDRSNDGVISGYPANYSAEWATSGQTTGAWLNLTWDAYYLVDSVVLYVRLLAPHSKLPLPGELITFAPFARIDQTRTIGSREVRSSLTMELLFPSPHSTTTDLRPSSTSLLLLTCPPFNSPSPRPLLRLRTSVSPRSSYLTRNLKLLLPNRIRPIQSSSLLRLLLSTLLRISLSTLPLKFRPPETTKELRKQSMEKSEVTLLKAEITLKNGLQLEKVLELGSS